MRGIIVVATLGVASAAGDDFSGTWQLNYERSTLEGAAPSAPMKVVATFQLDSTATLSVNIFGFGNGQRLQSLTISHFDRCNTDYQPVEVSRVPFGWPYAVKPATRLTATAACWEFGDGTRVLQVLMRRGGQVVIESRRSLDKAATIITETITGTNEQQEPYRMTLVWERR